MTPDELPKKEGWKIKLDRFEDHHAVITTDDGQKLLVTKERLPRGAKEGDELWLHIETNAMRDEERKKMAQALLDEILNPAS
ncbi:MAG: DUF3006 domain-containing protein [bacterium]|nr:DUF3006 domain-containing protein [bacterium]